MKVKIQNLFFVKKQKQRVFGLVFHSFFTAGNDIAILIVQKSKCSHLSTSFKSTCLTFTVSVFSRMILLWLTWLTAIMRVQNYILSGTLH